MDISTVFIFQRKITVASIISRFMLFTTYTILTHVNRVPFLFTFFFSIVLITLHFKLVR